MSYKLPAVAIAAAVIAASPAHARDGQAYVGIEAGAMFIDDIEASLSAVTGARLEILPLSRGAYRWRIGVPPSGALAQAGTSPTPIQWETERPTAALPDAGCRLEKLVLAHPDAPAGLAALRAAGLDPDEPVEARREGPHGLQAQVRTPRGIVVIHG